MYKYLISLLVLIPLACFGTTPSPVSTLNPAGSDAGWVVTSTGPTTPPAWAAVTLSGLGGLAKASNLSDVASVSTSRTNLGLGTAAVVNTGTSGATIPLLSTANTWTLAQTFTVGPIAPTATAGTNTTQVATTAFTTAAVAAVTPTAMTSYTPTVTAASGTFTTVSATGHYYLLGKLVFFEISVAITTVGTASAGVIATLPFPANSSGGAITFAGQEQALTGKTLQGTLAANSSNVSIRYYDATSAIAAGAVLVVSGCYVSN